MTTAAADVRWAVKVMISRPLVFFFFGCRSSPSILHFRRKNEFLSSFCVTCCFFSYVSSSSSFLRIEFSVPKLWLYRFPQGIRFHVACVFTLWKWVTSRWAIRAQHSRKYRSPVVSFTMLTFFFLFLWNYIYCHKGYKSVLLLYFLFIFKEKKKKDYTLPYMVERSGDLVVPGTASLLQK